jgi:hypothetical protein
MTPDEAREAEGFAPGSVDFASVPPQLPGATPNLLPVNRSTAGGPVRCPNGHLLAEQATPPYRFTCFRCKETVAA